MSGIVVGLDGSHHSEQVLEWATREAALRRLPLKVIRVYQPVVGPGGPGRLGGSAADELLGAAVDADLVVIGSHGAGEFARLMMGSVSAQICQRAQCPVVMIPSPRR